MNRDYITSSLYSVPSQEWLSEVLEWLHSNPSTSSSDWVSTGDRQILDTLLYSRGARKRFESIREFVSRHDNKITNITTLIGLEQRDTVRQSVDKWLSEENIVEWLLKPDRTGREFLWEERDFETGVTWLRLNYQTHPKPYTVPNLLSSLMYYQPKNPEVPLLAERWCLDNMSSELADRPIHALVRSPHSTQGVALARKYVLINLPKDDAQRMLRTLLRLKLLKGKKKHELVSMWRQIDVSNRDCGVLAELIKENPQRRSLIKMANEAILDSHYGSSTLVSAVLTMKGHNAMKRFIRSWVAGKLISGKPDKDQYSMFCEGEKGEDFSYVYACLDAAFTLVNKYGDYELLDLFPKNFWINNLRRYAMISRLVYPEVLSKMKSFADRYPDSPVAFQYQCKLSDQGDRSATEWIRDWLEEAIMPQQIIRGTDVILRANPGDDWATAKANECVSNQIKLGWGSEEADVAARLRRSGLNEYQFNIRY